MNYMSPELKSYLATKMPASMTTNEKIIAARLKIKEIYFISEIDQPTLGLCCSCLIVKVDNTYISLETTNTVSAVLNSCM